MIRVTLKFFGPLRDFVGTDEMDIACAAPLTGETAFEALSAKHPGIRTWKPSLRLAVNLEYAEFTRELNDGDEISFLPPVSGG